ncbi:hypothetical protein XENOCAPTIV_026162 [Xenoophorus captivus]|uniref:Ig-like domain-containing protein n=1 Tax=Xenoophorus captivus TaxID=1517983 RepID=A0ABV0SH22_9TELE
MLWKLVLETIIYSHNALTSLLCDVSSPADQRIITAKPGEDFILPCRAAKNKDVIFAKWSRTDLESDPHVLSYSWYSFYLHHQCPSFKNRVDLKDVENGDVSLILKNVTSDDTGTYVC